MGIPYFHHCRYLAPAFLFADTVSQTSRPLPLSIPVPDHAFFPLYAPSFTLDVPQGNMQDLNTNSYLCEVERCFENVLRELEPKMTST
jgi:histone deacetylase 8